MPRTTTVRRMMLLYDTGWWLRVSLRRRGDDSSSSMSSSSLSGEVPVVRSCEPPWGSAPPSCVAWPWAHCACSYSAREAWWGSASSVCRRWKLTSSRTRRRRSTVCTSLNAARSCRLASGGSLYRPLAVGSSSSNSKVERRRSARHRTRSCSHSSSAMLPITTTTSSSIA